VSDLQSTPSRRVGRLAVVAVLAVVVAAVVMLAAVGVSTASAVADDARDLKSEVDTAVGAATAGDLDGAADAVDRIAVTANRLEERTTGALWQGATHLPFVGSTLTATSTLADSAQQLAAVAQPLANRIRDSEGAVGALARMAGSGPEIQALVEAAEAADARLAALPPNDLHFGVGEAVAQAQDLLPALADGASSVAEVVDLLPALLGQEGPTRWLVMLQNPAEARGSGGLFSAFAIVEVDDGKPTIVEAATRKAALDELDIPYARVAADDTAALWGADLEEWASFNQSLDFPTVAELAAAGMAARGTPVDGVVALDPAVVGALLTGTGPVEHDGVSVDGTSAVPFFTKDIYTEYPDFPDVAAKDELAMGLLFATVDSVLARPLDYRGLWNAMKPVVEAGHLRMWSADPRIQDWLAGTPVGGVLPTGGGPTVGVALNNATGGKVDAYVDGTVDYAVAVCQVSASEASAPEHRSTVTISLSNSAPEALPDYVDFRLDAPQAPAGSTRILVSVYGPVDSWADSARLDDTPVEFGAGQERGRPVWTFDVELASGATRDLVVTFDEPASDAGEPTVIVSGTANDLATTATTVGSADTCATS
jgi:hypothetical protein